METCCNVCGEERTDFATCPHCGYTCCTVCAKDKCAKCKRSAQVVWAQNVNPLAELEELDGPPVDGGPEGGGSIRG